MAKRTGPVSTITKNIIADLKTLSTKEKVKIWRRIADDLSKSTRSRRKVNVYKLNKFLREGETGVVPGKVLSQGDFNKKNTIAAFQFSETAREIINSSGKAVSIRQLMKDNPKGKKDLIIHDYKQPEQRVIKLDSIVGPGGYIIDKNAKNVVKPLQALLETKQGLQEINDIYKWLTGVNTYLFRVNQTLDTSLESVAGFDADSYGAILNCGRDPSDSNSGLGVRRENF